MLTRHYGPKFLLEGIEYTAGCVQSSVEPLLARDFMNEFLSTTQGITILSASIGATAVLLSQILAGIVALVREIVMENRKVSRDAKLVAIHCALGLNNFINECCSAVKNSTLEIDPNNSMNVSFPTNSPALHLAEGLNWSSLDPQIVEKVFWLQAELRNVSEFLESLDLCPPTYDDIEVHRSEKYADLGLHGVHLLTRICRAYGLQQPNQEPEVDSKKIFDEKIREAHEYWRRQEAAPKGLLSVETFAETKG